MVPITDLFAVRQALTLFSKTPQPFIVGRAQNVIFIFFFLAYCVTFGNMFFFFFKPKSSPHEFLILILLVFFPALFFPPPPLWFYCWERCSKLLPAFFFFLPRNILLIHCPTLVLAAWHPSCFTFPALRSVACPSGKTQCLQSKNWAVLQKNSGSVSLFYSWLSLDLWVHNSLP